MSDADGPSFPRSACPVVAGLDVLGDRWTLVVVRDLVMGKRRFAEFLDSPEGIATNVLSDRLRRLEEAGLVARHRYQDHPPRDEYRLTDRGCETLPILQAVVVWANRHIPGTWTPPREFLEMTPESLRARLA